MNTQYDFLAIGDVVTDAFIRVKDAEAHCEVDSANCKLCFRFGDKVPYESVDELRAVGNSANAAVAAARLGLSTGLLSHVGKDYQGEGCIEELKKNNVGTEFVFAHEGLKTNYHYVLWYDVERTILIKHTAFPYIMPNIPAMPRMIYLSSLGENSLDFHHKLAEVLEKHPETKLVFQPGTFQIKFGVLELRALYKLTYAFFCNVEEAQRILGVETRDLPTLLRKIHELGPKLVFITDGIKGAYATDGTDMWFMPVYPQDPYERTGAGDAFSSTTAIALLMGKTVPEALKWGPINSMSVVQYVGAQKGLLTREQLDQYLADAPANYEATTLM